MKLLPLYRQAMLTILVYQVAGTVHAAQSGFLQTTVLSSLFFIAWAECHYHRVPSKFHDISIIQQYQVNDLSSTQDIRAEQHVFSLPLGLAFRNAHV